MQQLDLLGIALGLASLAGINLYLTVFVSGLAIRFHWITLDPSVHELSVLGNPIILGVAGALYLVEFFADKIPWLDSAWDAIHTFIRPVGAAALAILVLGDSHPTFEVIAALLAGGTALSTHLAKSGTRLVANGSPEPLSNIGLSLGEDALVIGGLGLLAWSPIIALVISLVVTAAILFFLPRLVRGVRAKLWLIRGKLNEPAEPLENVKPDAWLPEGHESTLRKSHPGKAEIQWAAPCLSGSGPSVPANLRGWLLQLAGEPDRMFFVCRRWSGGLVLSWDVRGADAQARAGFLCHKLLVVHRDGNPRNMFLFERSQGALVSELARILQCANQSAVRESVIA